MRGRQRACGGSLLLQEYRDVDVPADGLPVKATGEEVAGLVLLVPNGAAYHTPVALEKSKWKITFK